MLRGSMCTDAAISCLVLTSGSGLRAKAASSKASSAGVVLRLRLLAPEASEPAYSASGEAERK